MSQTQNTAKQMQMGPPSQMQNHMNPQNHMNTQQILNHALNNTGGLPPQMQMPPMPQGSIYDHMHPNVNMNGVNVGPPPGPGPKDQQQQPMVYLGGQPPMNIMAQQNQYMTRNATAAVSQ